jgi:hypothetical protein
MATNQRTQPDTIRAGAKVTLPNGNTATVQLVSGRSAICRVGNASAWYEIAKLTVTE